MDGECEEDLKMMYLFGNALPFLLHDIGGQSDGG